MHSSGSFGGFANSQRDERSAGRSSLLRPGLLRSQRGAGRLKALIFLVVFAAMIYTGIKVVPILVTNYEFQDAIESTARFATVNRQSSDEVRAAVLKEAQSEAIPITAADIHVRGEGGNVEISADYSVTVDLRFYQWTLNFHPAAKNDKLL